MEWSLNDDEKKQITETFLRFYDGVDRISVVVALPLFRKAGNSKESAEKIWMLIDVQGIGRVTFGEFLVGLHIANTRIPGELIPTCIPENLVQLLNEPSPVPVENAVAREARMLLGSDALESNLAKWAFRSYNDPFELLSNQALRVLGYLCINPFGLTRTVRSRVNLGTICVLLKSHLSHPVHSHVVATILCCISANFPADLSDHIALIARLCVRDSGSPDSTRLLLLASVANCASVSVCVPKILDNSVSRSSVPWITTFVDRFETEMDPQFLTESVRFILNWSISDPTNRAELILSRFLHVLMDRVPHLPPLGLCYMMELSAVICQDLDIFTLLFHEFKLLEKVFQPQILHHFRYTRSLQTFVFFLSQVPEMRQRAVLLNKVGICVIRAVFFSSSENYRKSFLAILSQYVNLLSNENISDFGLPQFFEDVCCSDSLNADDVMQAITCMNKMHARGIVYDMTQIFFTLGRKGDVDSLLGLMDGKSHLIIKPEVVPKIIINLVSRGQEWKNISNVLKLIHSLMLEIEYFVDQDTYAMVMVFMTKNFISERQHADPLVATTLARLVIRNSHLVSGIMSEEHMFRILSEGGNMGLRALVKVMLINQNVPIPLLYGLVESWKTLRGTPTNEMIQLIALLVFSDRKVDIPKQAIALLINALPGNHKIRDLVFLCIAEILRRDDGSVMMLSSPMHIGCLLHASIIHELDERTFMVGCEILFRLWCSDTTRRVLYSCPGLSETIVFLLRCTRRKLPVTLLVFLPSMDADIPYSGTIFQTVDIFSSLASQFHDAGMNERLTGILSRKNVLTASDLTESDVEAVCYFRILHRIIAARITRVRSHTQLTDFLVNVLPKQILSDLPFSTMLHYKKSTREGIPLQVSILLDFITYVRRCFLVPCRYEVISESSKVLDRLTMLIDQPVKPTESRYNSIIRSEISTLITCARMR